MVEAKDFKTLRTALATVLHNNPETCRTGYRALLNTTSMQGLCELINHYWADLNHALWKDFQSLLQQYYSVYEYELNKYGIYYNTTCDHGKCCIDDNMANDCMVVKGNADAAVHGTASVLVLDQAHVTLLGRSKAQARDCSRVDAREWSTVVASDFSRVRAVDKAKVTSEGSTEIYLYGNSQLKNIRSRKVETGSMAIVLSENEEWK